MVVGSSVIVKLISWVFTVYKDLLLLCVTEMVSSILDPLIWNELSGAGASQPLHDECRFFWKKATKTNIPSQTNEIPNKTNNNKRASP